MNFSLPSNLLPHHGSMTLFSSFFNKNESDDLLRYLIEKISWDRQPVKIFGREILQPRLTASFADESVSYGYTGITLENFPWTPEILQIKGRVEERSGFDFNSALLNLYRDGKDYMGWHRDNEKQLGVNPPVASVSFGAARKFQLRTYQEKSELVTINLGHGDLLVMAGETQHCWEHRLPKSAGVNEPRVNITFRKVMH